MRNINPYYLLIFSACMLLGFVMPKKKTRIFLAGDSTICYYGPERAPVTGWGMPFAHFFDSTISVHNHGKGGRSTRTFIQEGRWKLLSDSLTEGDLVFIQFGHNDEAKEERYKDRYTTVPDYKSNLELMIRETRSKKAIPVLVTPVSRLRFGKEGQALATHEAYTAAMYEVANATGTQLIDLDRDSRELYQKMGPKDAPLLFMHLAPGEHPVYPEGQKDNTHFNEYGARRIATLVLHRIRELKLPIATHITPQH